MSSLQEFRISSKRKIIHYFSTNNGNEWLLFKEAFERLKMDFLKRKSVSKRRFDLNMTQGEDLIAQIEERK